MASFQKKVVKEDKSSFPPFAAARVRVVKEDKSSFPPFAAARVYEVVRKIPKGKILTYGEVAKKIGHSKAYRAVGNVLNKNTNPEVPCHRVIKSDGKVGGYRGGTKKKTSLLKKEGMIIKDRRIVV